MDTINLGVGSSQDITFVLKKEDVRRDSYTPFDAAKYTNNGADKKS